MAENPRETLVADRRPLVGGTLILELKHPPAPSLPRSLAPSPPLPAYATSHPLPLSHQEDRTLAAASMAMILASGNGCSDKILPSVVEGLVAASVDSPLDTDANKSAALNSNAASTLESFVGQTSNVPALSFARALVTKENMDRVFDRLMDSKEGDGTPSLSVLRSGLTYVSLATFLTQGETPGVADVAGAVYGEMLDRDFLSRVVSLTRASEDPELRVRAGDILGAMLSSSADLKKAALERHVCKELMANLACGRSTQPGAGDNLGPALALQPSKEDEEKRKLHEHYHNASDELCLTSVGMLLKEDQVSTREIVGSPEIVGWLSKLMGQGSQVAKLIFQALGTSEYRAELADSMRHGAQLP
jgi:hypothetical protein